MIKIDIKRTSFYEELSFDESKLFFDRSQKKYLPNIDNIYYSVSVLNDHKGNSSFSGLFHKLSSLKELVRATHKPVCYDGDLLVVLKGFEFYKYCLSASDLYDIFILEKIPNESTPRFIIQIRSYGLWVNGWKSILDSSFAAVEKIVKEYGCEVNRVYENRIDYCFHTNSIQNPERLFSDRKVNNTLQTTFERYHITGRLGHSEDKNKLYRDYFALGERKSNYVFVRFYNKALEVIEMGYKSYFFEIWFKNGLINFYDKFCFEYAYERQNFNAIHRGKMEFYIKYGSDEPTKERFRELLENENISFQAIKKACAGIMPECTKVLNVEIETKRKFYYLSDEFINNVLSAGDCPQPDLARMYKIVNNRRIFLDWLTSRTLNFVKKDGSVCDWWERLRSTKIDCIETDKELVRDYSNRLDKQLMQRRLVSSIASNSVYHRHDTEGTFIENLADVLSNINDNDKSVLIQCCNEDGEILDDMYAKLLLSYESKKNRVYSRIKNRLNVSQTSTKVEPMGATVDAKRDTKI